MPSNRPNAQAAPTRGVPSALAPRPRLRSGPPRHDDIEELYLRYRGLVLRRARRFYPDEEAHDVVQDVFTRAIEKLGGFRGESSPGTWLHQLTTRHCLNRLRDTRRRQEIVSARASGPSWGSSSVPASQDANVLTRQLLDTLDEELLRVGLYFHLEGLSHADIAERIGVSRRTVGNRLGELEVLLKSRAGEA